MAFPSRIQIALHPSALQSLQRAARFTANRLVMRFALPRERAADIAGDLLLFVFEHADGFDPQKGTFVGYARMIMRRQAMVIGKRLYRHLHAEPESLQDGDVDPGVAARHERLTEADSLWRAFGEPFDEGLHRLRCRTLNRLIKALPADERRLCRHFLANWSIAQLIAEGVYSRSTLYRRLNRIRAVAERMGLEFPDAAD